ncbi:MAG: 50S ribosomal protein L3 N(5)-glutamine methyltransferase [Puniceicoccales bacterium]|jgi:ribosomal protein L3 glutamine methyltransferase|nr:50S ribosomal protein L3 N(5)-glutamine methyltransferase [Puniceicoccales bacterium]
MRELPGDLGSDLLTVRDWLRYATSLFTREKLAFGQGVTCAFDEAVWLVCHTLSLPRESWETFLDARLAAAEKTALQAILRRRAFDREPAAYITGEAWLGDLSFRVDKRVVIPRSYFLEVIPEQLNQWLRDPTAVAHAADVCTGSGCLAILLARAYPDALVDATDISADALEVAAQNIADYALEERVTPHRADVLTGVPPPPAGYDIIVCNPPYEPETLAETLPAEFRREPQNGLFSGADGMDVIRKLLPQAAAHLADAGVLLVETGGLRETLETEFPKLEINWLTTDDASDCIALFHASALRETFPPKSRQSRRPAATA